MAASLTPRFGNPPSNDNTGRQITQRYLNPVYAASIALNITEKETTAVFQTLTGALALSVVTTNSFLGDILTCLFVADATGRTVTFGAGFSVSAATLVLAGSKKGSITLMFDGVHFVEQGRSSNI